MSDYEDDAFGLNNVPGAPSAEERAARDKAWAAARATREAPLVTIALDTAVDYSGRAWDPDGPEPGPDVTVLDLIIKEAAKQVIANADREYGSCGVQKSLLDIVRTEVTSQAKQKAEAIVTEALEAPFKATNQWGEAVGKETTLRALIVDHAQEWLKGSLPDRRDSYDRQRDPKGGPAVVKVLVDDTLKKELKGAVEEATKQARETVKLRASEIVGQAIADGLRFS